RVGIRVDLDDRDLGALLVEVLVERDQLWLVRLDEIDEAWHSRPLVFELPRLEPVGGDENERSRHGVSFLDRGPLPTYAKHSSGAVLSHPRHIFGSDPEGCPFRTGNPCRMCNEV